MTPTEPGPTIPPSANWTGWLRLPGRRWEAVCGGATEGAAMAALLDFVKGTPGHTDLTVLPEGERPSDRVGKRTPYVTRDMFPEAP